MHQSIAFKVSFTHALSHQLSQGTARSSWNVGLGHVSCLCPVSQSYQNRGKHCAESALGLPSKSHVSLANCSKGWTGPDPAARTAFHQSLSSVTTTPSNRDAGQEEAGVGRGHLGPVRKQRHDCCCPASFSLSLVQDLSPRSQITR